MPPTPKDIRAILDYAKANKMAGVVIAFEADFAPFQPWEQTAIVDENMGPTLQFLHPRDFVASRFANKGGIEGAQQQDTSKDKAQVHAIRSFINQIFKLPTGNYRVENGEIIPLTSNEKNRIHFRYLCCCSISWLLHFVTYIRYF